MMRLPWASASAERAARHRLPAVLLAAAVTACTTGGPPEIGYLPPANAPVSISRAVVGQPRDLVWNQVIDHLQQSGLELAQIEEQTGTIVARYSGDPEPYVSCGWIVTHRPGDLRQVPASIQQTSLERVVGGSRMVLDRSLRLDGRIVVRLTPQGEDTVVTANSTYVLTKTVNTAHVGGSVRGQNVETLSFRTGERERFEKGTVCQPTGALELAALGALPVVANTGIAGQVSAAREPPPAIEAQPLEPFEPVDEAGGAEPEAPTAAAAPAPASLDCEGDDRAYCAMLEITAPYSDANRQQEFGLAIGPAAGSTTLEEGSELALDLGLPDYDAYIEVSYLQRDGTVGHILPRRSEPWPAGGEHPVRETGYEIAEPFGVEMIVAIATEEPLFPQPRPRFEPVEDYLGALRARLADLRAADPDQKIAVDRVFVTTVPAGGAS